MLFTLCVVCDTRLVLRLKYGNRSTFRPRKHFNDNSRPGFLSEARLFKIACPCRHCLLQANATAVESQYTAPLRAFMPIMTDSGSGVYLDVAVWTAQNTKFALCERGSAVYTRYPIDLHTLRISTT